MVTDRRLEARDLTFSYPGGAAPALNGVTFGIAPGELTVLLGPNGSGKSTLVRLLAGLLVGDSGTVTVGGRDLRRLAPREAARSIAVVPQSLPRIPTLRVDDFVLGGRYAHFGFWRTASQRDHDAVHDALAKVGAEDCAGRLLADMSGGQRQRVLVARALAQDADFVLFDEPTASLDPEHQVRVTELVVELVADGRGAVVVTHDFNLAAQIADRVVLLREGRVAGEGAVDAVLRPESLEPVYGRHLHFGALPDGAGPLIVTRHTQAAAPNSPRDGADGA